MVPEVHAGFYFQALDQINDKLKQDPSNIVLAEQKIYYCEQLEWPTTCISALELYKEKFGMSNQLVEQYLSYYLKHERYQLIQEMIERWNEEFDLIERYHAPYIAALVRSNQKERARLELQSFLKRNTDAEGVSFAARQYLNMRDTAYATYYLSKLEQLAPEHSLMYDYGKLLIALNKVDRADAKIRTYLAEQGTEEDHVEVAHLYEATGYLTRARQVLKPYATRDTLAYLLVDWYKREFFWDSAVLYLDTVLVQDSLNTKAWWKKGRMYEDRGWLSYSLQYFERLLEINPSDSSAMDRIALIQRKIAYLQRQKFEESKIPVLELEPLKIKN
ncbi:MAG: hypothetical protein Tsb0034_26490 [Ekhidna sp.]